QCAPRARVEGLEGREVAHRQKNPARRGDAFDQSDRGPGTRRGPYLPIRGCCRPRRRHRLDRLRAGRPRPCPNRLGQAQGAVGRRGDRYQAPVAEEGGGIFRSLTAKTPRRREIGICTSPTKVGVHRGMAPWIPAFAGMENFVVLGVLVSWWFKIGG